MDDRVASRYIWAGSIRGQWELSWIIEDTCERERAELARRSLLPTVSFYSITYCAARYRSGLCTVLTCNLVKMYGSPKYATGLRCRLWLQKKEESSERERDEGGANPPASNKTWYLWSACNMYTVPETAYEICKLAKTCLKNKRSVLLIKRMDTV